MIRIGRRTCTRWTWMTMALAAMMPPTASATWSRPSRRFCGRSACAASEQALRTINHQRSTPQRVCAASEHYQQSTLSTIHHPGHRPTFAELPPRLHANPGSRPGPSLEWNAPRQVGTPRQKLSRRRLRSSWAFGFSWRRAWCDKRVSSPGERWPGPTVGERLSAC